MSFHEELQILDTSQIGTAIGTVVGKVGFESGGPQDVAAALKHYGTLSVLPDALTTALEQADPATSAEDLQRIRLGATLLASVLAEYAQLVELEGRFPDAPPEHTS